MGFLENDDVSHSRYDLWDSLDSAELDYISYLPRDTRTEAFFMSRRAV